MRVKLIPQRPARQAMIALLQRGLLATLANPHPFAPTLMAAPQMSAPQSAAGP